ncbi:hypothetical protein [uncultured Caulobacter sp.]|uniref:hypothetical protein n=1 Tax=uncultured Caulobacter sp. TaxID=158749 RepID=UPI0026344B27|nr:hypothetical protein [uncultured Caulobacter sp.]
MPDTSLDIVHPFLSRFSVARTGSPEIVGRFSPSHDVWVVDGPDGAVPIISTRSDLGDTSTITRVRAEQDDTDLSCAYSSGTSTFTAVRAEIDDQDRAVAMMREVTTKTEQRVERDDVAKEIGAFEPQMALSAFREPVRIS